MRRAGRRRAAAARSRVQRSDGSSLRSITGSRWNEAPLTANGNTPSAIRCTASTGADASGRPAARSGAATIAVALAASQQASATRK